MSCFGIFCSVLLRRNIVVNDQQYHVVKRIGEGGFSYVDLVNRQGYNYAVKRMLLQVPEQREIAENEVRIHQTVQHRNVLHLEDSQINYSGTGEGTAVLVFPYYRNGTLQDLIEHAQTTSRPLPEKRILKLFVSLCHGLQAFHLCRSGPITHRDVKPGNMLLTDGGDELVLMDLGSATDSECKITTRQQALALQELCAQTCTAHYRAPELFEVPSIGTITCKSDIWSLGCSLYAAAFGQSPCDGSALAAMSGRIVFPRQHVYSEEFCEMLLWILQVEPDERPAISEVEQRIVSMLDEPNL